MHVSILLMASAFTFHVEKDRFDDRETYVAEVRIERNVALKVYCGAATDREFIVLVTADRPLQGPLFVGDPNRYATRVRFDDRPTMNMKFRYVGWDAYTELGNAFDFASNLKGSREVSIELADRAASKFYITFPTANGAEAVEQVKQRCFAPR